MNRLAIVGGGSWGTALSIVLAPRFERVRLWAHEREVVQSIADKRQNESFSRAFGFRRRWSRRAISALRSKMRTSCSGSCLRTTRGHSTGRCCRSPALDVLRQRDERTRERHPDEDDGGDRRRRGTQVHPSRGRSFRPDIRQGDRPR